MSLILLREATDVDVIGDLLIHKLRLVEVHCLLMPVIYGSEVARVDQGIIILLRHHHGLLA